MDRRTEEKFQDYFGIKNIEQLKSHVKRREVIPSYGDFNENYLHIPVEYENIYKITVNEEFIRFLEFIIEREEREIQMHQYRSQYLSERRPLNLARIYQELRRDFENQQEDYRLQQKHPELAEIIKDYKAMKKILTS